MPETRPDGPIPTPTGKLLPGRFCARSTRRTRTSARLDPASAWQLPVVTVLSAQTADATVNRVSPHLFARYPRPREMAEANIEDVEQIVFSTGFYRQKAAAVVALAADLVDRFGGGLSMRIIQLGRDVCAAKAPDCTNRPFRRPWQWPGKTV